MVLSSSISNRFKYAAGPILSRVTRYVESSQWKINKFKSAADGVISHRDVIDDSNTYYSACVQHTQCYSQHTRNYSRVGRSQAEPFIVNVSTGAHMYRRPKQQIKNKTSMFQASVRVYVITVSD